MIINLNQMQEDVTYDLLPNNSLDELKLADGPVGKPRQAVFSLRNHNMEKMFRFKWPAAPNLTFSPAIGHLLPGSSKDITVTFLADVPVKLNPQEVKLALMQITHKEGVAVQDWDDRSVVVDYSAADSQGGQPSTRPEPEPAVNEVAGTAKELPLKVRLQMIMLVAGKAWPQADCSNVPVTYAITSLVVPLQVFAVADNAKYACDLKPILFKPTMMFQTRSFTFPLENTSSSQMDYKFTVSTSIVNVMPLLTLRRFHARVIIVGLSSTAVFNRLC